MEKRPSAAVTLCIAIWIAVLQCPAEAGHGNDLVVGHRTSKDSLLELAIIQRKWTIAGSIRAEFHYRSNIHTKISYIEALDQSADGYGAEARIAGGGVGHNFVDVSFQSQTFCGIYFVVKIYGVAN